MPHVSKLKGKSQGLLSSAVKPIRYAYLSSARPAMNIGGKFVGDRTSYWRKFFPLISIERARTKLNVATVIYHLKNNWLVFIDYNFVFSFTRDHDCDLVLAGGRSYFNLSH